MYSNSVECLENKDFYVTLSGCEEKNTVSEELNYIKLYEAVEVTN